MKCHQLLNFPCPIFDKNFKKKIEKFNNIDTYKSKKYQLFVFSNAESLHKDFLNLLSEINLPIHDSGLVFCTGPNSSGFAHRDSLPEAWRKNGNICHTSLNLHLSLYPGSLEFYDNDADGINCSYKIENFETDAPSMTYENTGNLIDYYSSLKPALVRTNFVHKAINNSKDSVRIVYTVRFQENPFYEDVLEKFRLYFFNEKNELVQT